jgi:hypothetical protein
MDNAGWYESHQNNEGGTTSEEVFFNVQPNSLYACWINSSAAVFGDGGGVLGVSASSIHLHIELAAVYVE